MIEVRISVEEDIYDKNLKSITTIGTEETFALPEKFSAVDKFTLIRGVRDYLENVISQAELRQQKRDAGDAVPEDQLDVLEEHWRKENESNRKRKKEC